MNKLTRHRFRIRTFNKIMVFPGLFLPLFMMFAYLPIYLDSYGHGGFLIVLLYILIGPISYLLSAFFGIRSMINNIAGTYKVAGFFQTVMYISHIVAGYMAFLNDISHSPIIKRNERLAFMPYDGTPKFSINIVAIWAFIILLLMVIMCLLTFWKAFLVRELSFDAVVAKKGSLFFSDENGIGSKRCKFRLNNPTLTIENTKNISYLNMSGCINGYITEFNFVVDDYLLRFLIAQLRPGLDELGQKFLPIALDEKRKYGEWVKYPDGKVLFVEYHRSPEKSHPSLTSVSASRVPLEEISTHNTRYEHTLSNPEFSVKIVNDTIHVTFIGDVNGYRTKLNFVASKKQIIDYIELLSTGLSSSIMEEHVLAAIGR